MVAGNSLQCREAVACDNEVGVGDVTEYRQVVHHKVPDPLAVECTHVVVSIAVPCLYGKEQRLLGEGE